jgi:hypothetical protein
MSVTGRRRRRVAWPRREGCFDGLVAVLLAGAGATAVAAAPVATPPDRSGSAEVADPALGASDVASPAFAGPEPLGGVFAGISQGAVLTRAAADCPPARSEPGRRAVRRVFRSGLRDRADLPLSPRSTGARSGSKSRLGAIDVAASAETEGPAVRERLPSSGRRSGGRRSSGRPKVAGLSAESARSCGGAQRCRRPGSGRTSVVGSAAGMSSGIAVDGAACACAGRTRGWSRRSGPGRDVSGHADPVSHVPLGRGWSHGRDPVTP